MRIITFLFIAIISIGITYMLNQNHSINGINLPPPGKFLCPFTGFWQNAVSTAPPSDKTLSSPYLLEEVTVYYDERLVPHIFAKNDSDAYFAQGYITATHRLWQMDMATRAAGGRLAEVLGQKLLRRDIQQRKKGMVYAAENAIESWKKSPKAYNKLLAYTAGVNAYIDNLTEKEHPLEFKLLDYKPSSWSPLKTALFFKSMSEMLCSREEDIEATNTLKILGRKTFDFLFPEYNPLQVPVIPEYKKWDFEPLTPEYPPPSPDFSAPPSPVLPKTKAGVGSNNWAVSPQKTASGAPILCNDPHLGLTLPSTWFELQIHTPDYNAYGVSLPGIPGIIIGFNEHIAWGVTNVSQDVLDWYSIQWDSPAKINYCINGSPREVKQIVEKFEIRDNLPVFDTIKYTDWGPIVFESNTGAEPDLAMRWIAHDMAEDAEIDVFYKLNRARNYEDFSLALDGYSDPPQNFAFAHRSGDIAMRVQGQFPLKQKEQGRFLQEGDQEENAWKGFIPNAHNPSVYNPEIGFVTSTNQHSTSPDYPYYYNGFFSHYRSRYIHRRLSEMDSISVSDMIALQNDNYSILAEEALPLLLEHMGTVYETPQKSYIDSLKNWDYRFEAHLLSPAIFEEWFRYFYRKTWDEFYGMQDSSSVIFPEKWRTLALLKDWPDHTFFDLGSTPKKENAGDIARLAFSEMVQSFEKRKSESILLNWAVYKGTDIAHLSQSIPAFSHLNVDTGGHPSSLNAINNWFGPSWRMIVELGDPIKALGVYPGGQSGNPGSPFYDNGIDPWAKGAYFNLWFMDAKPEKNDNLLYRQVFSPAF